MEYPTYPVLIEKVNYKDYPNAELFLTRFAERDLPALVIGNEETQEVYTICNINPGDSYELKEFEFAIKDYSENEGMLTWLELNGFVEQEHDWFSSGWVLIPVCWATPKLKQAIKEICKTYQKEKDREEELF